MRILILFIEFFIIYQTASGNGVRYICEDGNAIEFRKTCDGTKDCPDGSDEIQKICYHIVCPGDKFRCHYGACIHNNSQCDGINQCADGSDEHHCGNNSGNCKRDEFKCASGECISNKKICDDHNDCKDESDEDPDTCEKITCPLNTYRCKVGGCIHLNLRCNGYKDCVDGSDESELLCKHLNCIGAQCDQCMTCEILFLQNNIYCPPITSTRITATCEVPSGNFKGIIPCNKPLPVGTIVRYECKPYYIPATSKHINNRQMVCQSDGTWNRECLKCKPDCGIAEPDVAPLIVHGWSPEHGKFPWHATLFGLESGNWTFICGGTLITEKVVLTAAHCTWSITKETLRVGLGKYYSDYHKIEDTAQIKDVSKIIKQPLYQDYIGNYGSDIAILVLNESIAFSSLIRPICIDWTLDDISDHLASDKTGLIVGMGVTENNTFSEKLKATYLPVVSDEECIKQQTRDFKKYITFTSFCAGWRNGTGVCNGDSGGGLVFPVQKNSHKWVLQGIVSVSPRRPGTSFCDPKYFTVFTKVGMYVKWIHKVLLDIHYDILHDPFEERNVIL